MLLLLVLNTAARAQVSIADSSISMGLIDVTYAGMWPGADLADRFGYTNLLGADVGYLHKSHWYVLGGFHFMFGENVKQQNQLDELAMLNVWPTDQGGVFYDYGFVDGNGNVHQPNYFQRGYVVPLRIGKIFPALRMFKGVNENSGPFVELGAQFIQHKIRIDFDTEEAPFLSDEMLKGYDRLTNGFGALQTIGYRLFSNNRYINLTLALEFSQNFTQNRRSLNYDTNTVEDETRVDLLYGLRVKWSFPLYRTAPEKYYYY